MRIENEYKSIPAALAIVFIGEMDLRVLGINNDLIILESEESLGCYIDLNISLFDFNSYSYRIFSFSSCTVIKSEMQEFSWHSLIQLSQTIDNSLIEFTGMVSDIWETARYIKCLRSLDNAAALEKTEFIKTHPPKLLLESDEAFFNNYREQEEFWFNTKLTENEYLGFNEVFSNTEMAY